MEKEINKKNKMKNLKSFIIIGLFVLVCSLIIVSAEGGTSGGGWFVQNGEIVVTGTETVNLDTAVDISKAFILVRIVSSAARTPDHLGVYAEWVNSTSFNLIQHTSGAVTAVWQVIESDDISVQNGTLEFAEDELSFNITIDSIDVSKTVVFMTESSCDSTDRGYMNEAYWTGNVTNSTNLYIQRDAGADCAGNVSYFVTEFNDGSTIQSGEIADVGLTASPSYAIVNTINMSNTWFYFSKAHTDPNLDESVRARPHNTTAFALSRRKTDGTARVQWYAISTPGAIVQNGTTNMDSSINTEVTIDAIIVNRSLSIDSSDCAGAGDAQDNGRSTSQILNTTTVAIKKGVISKNVDVSWQVVQLPEGGGEAPPTPSTNVSSNLRLNNHFKLSSGHLIIM